MHPQVQCYIERINRNDPWLTEIILDIINLTDNDVAPLMEALASNPNAAQQITRLNFVGTQLTAINIPAELVALTELHLCFNKLTAINIPAELGALTVLRLVGNQLTAINIPAELVALTRLDLSYNQLTAINIPAELVALTRLNLYDNKLTAINIPAELVALTHLNLEGNQLTAINIPAELVALTVLNLYCNKLTAINIPAELVALTQLRINMNQLTAINIPAELVALTALNLTDNQLTAINIPAELIALTELDLNGNQLTAINIPAELVALTELNLGNNQLTAINIPAELVALTRLYLNGNQLTVATEIALSIERIRRGDNVQILSDNPVPADTALTHDILNDHFNAVFNSVILGIQAAHPLSTMLARAQHARLANELTRVIIECLAIAPENLIASQLTWLKTVLSEQIEVIDTYMRSSEFKETEKCFLNAANITYAKSREEAILTNKLIRAYKICEGRETGFTPQADNKFAQEGFFQQYKGHNQAPNHVDLRLTDKTRIAPENNPYQVALYQPRI